MNFENHDTNETITVDGLSNVSRCSTIMSTQEFKHVWEISQFSVHQELHSPGECITSTKFGDDDHEFILKLFPAGKDEECSGHLSLFLQILRCPTNKLQFRVNFVIDTVDGPRGCPLNKNVVTINRGGIVTASKFFNIEQLKARSNRYMPNDILRITTDMVIYGEPSSQAIDPEEVMLDTSGLGTSQLRSTGSMSTSDILKETSLKCLLDSSLHSDFQVIVEGHSFHVHKAILAARSGYFESLLKPEHLEYRESKVIVEDISLANMRTILEYIYTMKVPEIDDPRDLIYAADRFLIEPLKVHLMNQMVRTTTMENIFSRLEMGYRLNDDRMFRKAALLFGKYKTTLTNSDEWKRLREFDPGFTTHIIETSWEEYEKLVRYPHSGKRRRTSS